VKGDLDLASCIAPLLRRRRQHRAQPPSPLNCEADLCFVARRLGLIDNERRTIIDKVRRLAERHGFPLPKRPRFVRASASPGICSIDAFSIWDRDAVERWLEGDLPPAEKRRDRLRPQGVGAPRNGQARAHLVASNG
jgi:hypothetical protein